MGVIAITHLTAHSLVCPACTARFTVQALASTPAAVARSTDFRPLYVNGLQVLQHHIHVCVACGYGGYRGWFRPQADLTDEVREKIGTHLTWNLRWARKHPIERYFHALRCAEWLDYPLGMLAHLALRGSHVAFEDGDVESLVFFRRTAIRYYRAALDLFDALNPNDRASATYLVGELYRRMHEGALALEWLTQAEALAEAEPDSWVARWAAQQRTDPKEMFT